MSNGGTESGDKDIGQAEALIDHLGRPLRNTLSGDLEQPAYPGDPAIPPEFTDTLQRVKQSVELREHGVEAVRATLDQIVPEAPKATTRPAKKQISSACKAPWPSVPVRRRVHSGRRRRDRAPTSSGCHASRPPPRAAATDRDILDRLLLRPSASCAFSSLAQPFGDALRVDIAKSVCRLTLHGRFKASSAAIAAEV